MGLSDSVEIFILDPYGHTVQVSFNHCIHMVFITATILQMKK